VNAAMNSRAIKIERHANVYTYGDQTRCSRPKAKSTTDDS
jgi:hypothetical protein